MVAIPAAFWSAAGRPVADERWLLNGRSVLVLTTLFWGYVTLTDIVYHEAMRIQELELTSIRYFPTWPYRLTQHLLLLPPLLLCYSLALRIGYKAGRWRMPQQIALALAFSLLLFWMMTVAGALLHALFGMYEYPFGIFARVDWATWVSSTVKGLLSYGFGLALLLGVAASQRYHRLQMRASELQGEWAGARLAALRSQLSPHTLFNVLHTIQARIGDDPEVAQSLVASLGDLLRGLLQAGEHEFTRLRDELKFVELYLGLQHGRFADRLAVRVQNEGVPSVWVPSLILQPLVENAVVHGLADHSGPVRVEVSWDLSPYRLQLKVVNSVGSPGTPRIGGFGLRCVRERLAVQFGAQAVLAFGAGEASTWVATLHLPVLREWEPDAPMQPRVRA